MSTRIGTLIVLLSAHFTLIASFEAPTKCKHDVDCPKNTNQFCRGDVCHDCLNCGQFHRNTGLRSSCLRDETECGSCIDGYREVINGHPPYGKQCEVPRSSQPHVDTFGDKRRRTSSSSSSTPSHTAEIGITVGVVVVGTAVVIAILAVLYRHLRKKQQVLVTRDASPSVVVMERMPIAASRQRTVTKRQESEDEFEAVPTETSAMTIRQDASTELREIDKADVTSKSRSSSTSSLASTVPPTNSIVANGTGTELDREVRS